MFPMQGGSPSSKLYVDDVFSTYLYNGNSSAQTINNGIDLGGKGGMTWIKQRSGTGDHYIFDTLRYNSGSGSYSRLNTASTAAQTAAVEAGLTAFQPNGFTLTGNGTAFNNSGQIYTSWTFRKAPKFFDVVTYTGNGTTQNIAHSLGVAPGMVIVKSLGIADWFVWHRGTTSGNYLLLNSTSAQSSFNAVTKFGNNTATVNPTSSVFTVGSDSGLNANTQTYVAHLFAHDPSADGIIQCGSFTTDASGNATVNLGWEAQYINLKASSAAGNWFISDSMRGMTADKVDNCLIANSSAAEAQFTIFAPTATGFSLTGGGASVTYIYLAIRRPNKPPTSGTEVFQPVTYTGTNTDNRLVNTGIKTDMAWFRQRNGGGTGYEGFVVGDRLRGQTWLKTGAIQAETFTADGLDNQIISTTEYGTAFSSMTGVWVGNNTGTAVTSVNINSNTTANNHIVEAFKRAPGFFDIVCYTGTGAGDSKPHSLGVKPALIIIKRRDSSATGDWYVFDTTGTGNVPFLKLNTTDAASSSIASQPTSTTFDTSALTTDISSATYVAYLFATLPGISKVGTYTGNGTSQTIDCGFSTGARFILIKCTSATGAWFVFDTARGIVAGNDSYLALNTTGAEIVNDSDSIDQDTSGFIVNQTVTNLNVNSATYIYLAIA